MSIALLCAAMTVAAWGCKSADESEAPAGEKPAAAPADEKPAAAQGDEKPAAAETKPAKPEIPAELAAVELTVEQKASCDKIRAWPLEKLPLPPPFAPSSMPEGRGELRFSPGMLKPGDKSYFSYTFALAYKEPYAPDKAKLEKLFAGYWSGLMTEVAKARKIELPANHTRATVSEKDGGFTAVVETRDAFDKGDSMTLNVRVRPVGGSCLIVMASPTPFGSEIWSSLEPAAGCLGAVCNGGTTQSMADNVIR